MNIGYIRVSTDRQTVENQRFEINNKYNIDRWVEETISSRVKIDKRLLSQLLKDLNKGDTLIVSELSRLGRSIIEIVNIMQSCITKEVKIIALKENFTLDNTIQSKVMSTILALLAEIERDLISQRTKEALKRVKSEGKILGRKKGFKCSKLSNKAPEIKAFAKLNTIAETARHFNTSRKSIYHILKNF